MGGGKSNAFPINTLLHHLTYNTCKSCRVYSINSKGNIHERHCYLQKKKNNKKTMKIYSGVNLSSLYLLFYLQNHKSEHLYCVIITHTTIIPLNSQVQFLVLCSPEQLLIAHARYGRIFVGHVGLVGSMTVSR